MSPVWCLALGSCTGSHKRWLLLARNKIFSARQTVLSRVHICVGQCRNEVSVSRWRRQEFSPRSQMISRRVNRLGGRVLFQWLAFVLRFWPLPCFPHAGVPSRSMMGSKFRFIYRSATLICAGRTILHSVGRSSDGHHLTRLFWSTQRGRCKAAARAAPHY
jgi:hypothetical protein